MARKLIRLLTISLLLLISKPTIAQWVEYEPFYGVERSRKVLQNGNYNATVYYVSHTGYEASYNLIVTVEEDRVTSIHFPNGGYVHDGINSEGYYYDGGKLSPVTDNSGDIVAMKGVVEIRQYYYDEFALPHKITDYYYITIQ